MSRLRHDGVSALLPSDFPTKFLIPPTLLPLCAGRGIGGTYLFGLDGQSSPFSAHLKAELWLRSQAIHPWSFPD